MVWVVAGNNLQARRKAEQSDEVANEQRGNGSIFIDLSSDSSSIVCRS